jgi:hypothetical protein
MPHELEEIMSNHDEGAELVEIGKAQDVILGSSKGIYDDSPSQEKREVDTGDDE